MAFTLEDAIILATNAHKGQLDKANEPYILHPLRVMFRFPPCDNTTLERIIRLSDEEQDRLLNKKYYPALQILYSHIPGVTI